MPRAEQARREAVAPERLLKVLYLVPPSPRGQSLAAQSFIEEEIRTIRDWNVRPYVLTDTIRRHTTHDGIQVVGLRRLRLGRALNFGLFVVRHSLQFLKCFVLSGQPRRLLHAFRLEHAAAKLVRRERIDLLHSHFGWPGGLGGSVAAKWAGVPVIASIRGADVLVRADLNYGLRLDRSYDVALRHLFASASRILTETPFMQRATLALGAAPPRVRILGKGVDTEMFVPPANRTSAKSRLGLSGPVVLAVGNLVRRNGFDVLIEALARLREEDWTLVICGSGEERAPLEAKAQAAGIGARVRFAGHVPRAQIASHFAAADVFVHAAELEGAGDAILEALAAGCAVVCTRSGGPAEYVDDGDNGFVVPVGDVGALTSRLGELLRSQELRCRFGLTGRRRVEASHTYGRMMTRLRATYEQVLEEAAGKPFDSIAGDAPHGRSGESLTKRRGGAAQYFSS